MPTLLDNPGVSRIHNLSPGLPYRLTNLPNKSDDEPLHHCKPTSCLQLYPNQNNFGFLNLSRSFCKVKVNSGSSKSIWGLHMEVDLMERRGHCFFIGVRGWGSSMLRCDKRKISRLYISRGWHLCIIVAARCTVTSQS